MLKINHLIPALALAVLAAGCATQQPPGPLFPPAQPAQQPQPSQPANRPPLPGQPQFPGRQEQPVLQPPQPPVNYPRTSKDVSGAAVLSLLQLADEQTRSGQYKLASSSVERALHIEPRNPFVYQRLARIRLHQNQPGQAESLARKSSSLAVNNPYVQAQNWKLIARARAAQGDSVGSSAASSRAEYFRSQTAAPQ